MALLIALAVFPGCRASQKSATTTSQIAQTYNLRGKVVSTSPSTQEVTVKHEAIPGFMEAMTMPYKLKAPSDLTQLHPGDTITADLLVPADDKADLLLDHVVVVAQAKPN